ncbi:hypothetical protein BCS37_00885 [Selenomonas sp. oral taxon 920]|uniref:hypothetical protein n=1 Tax=Selenomonas sp. oral taxon 920 TaxID=1884263 RepID=UPI000840F20C|nr:hypothetical protein [Selenomonas sp. oral taxon 920]AOH47085.1 hypothetical protein BCS37_00885 [Selenomonas sp. oral taxon 920]
MKKWKSILAAAAALVCAGALFAGCGDGSGGGVMGSKGSADNGPAAPKEAAAKFKLGDKDVPLYEYTGAELPKFISGTTLAVTKDAIYGIAYGADKKPHLQKFALKDGAITGVEDLGTAEDMPVSSDGTNIYYILDGKGTVGCYDGTTATSFTVPNSSDVRRVYAIYGGKDAYISRSFASSDILFGAISKEGVKDPKIALSEKVYKELGKDSKSPDYETNAALVAADADGFYITTLATHGGKDNWTEPLHMHAPDGKLVRTFEVNTDIPADAQKRKVAERQSIATKDYVVFFANGFLRVFNKKDGKYVGDIELQLNGKSLSPGNVTTDDANRLYFTAFEHIYRIDL